MGGWSSMTFPSKLFLLVAGVCNAPNVLIIRFSLKLTRLGT